MSSKIFLCSFLFILYIFPSIFSLDLELDIVNCGRETKIKNACGVITQETVEEQHSVVRANVINLKDNCKKNEVCKQTDGTFCSCQPKLNFLHKGQKCTFNQECRSQQCGGEECQTVGSGQVCKVNWTCEPGYFCKDSGENYKCSPLVAGDSDCKPGDLCEPGYICDLTTEKCTKVGTIKESKETTMGIFCQSGLLYKGKCVSVIRDSECNLEGELYTCKPELSGITEESTTVPCVAINKQYSCTLSLLRTELFLKYKDKFDKIKYDKFNTNQKKRISEDNQVYLDDFDTLKAYIKYNYMSELIALGVMDTDGKIIDDCAFKYYWKTLNQKYIKLSKFIFGIILFALF